MINFVLVGAGYIAPRHAQAIRDVGGEITAFVDPHDSVGWMDGYFKDAKFFTEFERFDRHCNKIQQGTQKIDYAVILSPNYLHEAHSRWAMRNGMDVICEKPIALTERNVDAVAETEAQTGHKVWAILQSRLHAEVKEVRSYLLNHNAYVKVDYCAPRGEWFRVSWKSDASKSGGTATNIGVHLFDLMVFLFGNMRYVEVLKKNKNEISGRLGLDRAFIEWRISVDKSERQRRVFIIDDHAMDLTSGFADLHTKAYRSILDGNGYGIEDAREAIRIVEGIRCQ